MRGFVRDVRRGGVIDGRRETRRREKRDYTDRGYDIWGDVRREDG